MGPNVSVSMRVLVIESFPVSCPDCSSYARRPGIDDFDSAAFEVLEVARGEHGAMSASNRSDLRIGARDRSAILASQHDYRWKFSRCRTVERQNAIRKLSVKNA